MDIVGFGVSLLANLTLLGGIIAVAVALVVLYERLTKRTTGIITVLSNNALLLMFLVAFTATAGSLFLSEIALWAPCKDCWFQRIFMYPQTLLLALAIWKKDRGIAPYILLLSLVGAALSVHHYSEQIEATLNPEPVNPEVPCDESGVSCARTYTFRYGYITIPMMALTAFLLNIIGSLTVLRTKKA